MSIVPMRSRGRQSAAQREQYEHDLDAFCDQLNQIQSTVGFKVSSRGWCYLLEDYGLKKGDFDQAQRIINDCRKDGRLPIDFTKQDDGRAASGIEPWVDSEDPDEFAQEIVDNIESVANIYLPTSFWEAQDVYIEMMVEKVDLVTLFAPICYDYRIPITNAKGWSDINSRAQMAERFEEWESKGKECVLLYCGDHDPGGLNISDALTENFHQIEGGTGWPPWNLTIDRFGLNYDFIEANNLTWIENLQTSSGGDLSSPRHKDHRKYYVQSYLQQYGARKVEANALVARPDAGRKLCRESIEKHINLDAASAYRQEIDARREEVARLIREKMEEAA